MDESWRMRMGTPCLPRRRSVEDTSSTAASPLLARRSMDSHQNSDDFTDVFGGPPRSVLFRKFSGDFSRSTSGGSFYEEVFRLPEFVYSKGKYGGKVGGGGRSLPAFRIPARGQGFYSDVFGAEDGYGGGGRRSRERSRPNSNAKSKSNSSSVLSSEELSPLRRPVTGDDAALYCFASKLRPINVPPRWNSTDVRVEEQPRKVGLQSFPCNGSSNADNYYTEDEYNENFRSSSCIRVSRQSSSPETISVEPGSYRSIKVSVDDLELNSPSTPASSLCQEPEAKTCVQHDLMLDDDEVEQDEDDEVMSSYVIEINSDCRDGNCEAVSIEDAIAWAKEKYNSHSSSDREQEKDNLAGAEESRNTNEFSSEQIDRCGRTLTPMEEQLEEWRREEMERSKKDMEMQQLNGDIMLWSAGKETNIRVLLSTLHHILWPNSGWHAIPLTSLIQSAHVKKAYQKARLCLHPDKLQQRGATLLQKYVAEKAFSILQDAWGAFITQDVLFT